MIKLRDYDLINSEQNLRFDNTFKFNNFNVLQQYKLNSIRQSA